MSSAPTVFDPLAELRLEIEDVAQDPTAGPVERQTRLREFRTDLVDLQGLVDTYLGDTEVEEAAREDDSETRQAVARMRENADIRDRLIEAGQATAEACDDLLLYEHAELDRLAEEGLLEESALHAARFMEGLGIKFDPSKHPRGRGGKFSEVLGKIEKLNDGERADLGSKVSVAREGGKLKVSHGDRVVSTHTAVGHAAKSAHALVTKPPAPKAEAKRGPGGGWITSTDRKPDVKPEVAAAAKADVAAKAAERDLPDEQKKGLYDARKTDLEQRAAAAVAHAAAKGKLSDAESHFNDSGKVSQRTLATYVEEASTKPQTIDLYSSTDSSGRRVWDSSRQELHERIIGAYLRKRKIDPTSGKPVLDYSTDGEDLAAHPEGPKVLFSGGGYAAGKGGVLKILGAQGKLPPDSFVLDPDQIKAELPEFQAMIGTDPEANMHTYREAWAIAQEIQARAQDRKLNIVVDGISDTSPEEMGQRAKAYTDRGYAAQAVYVDIPTEEAMKRAANRAVNAKEDSDRRMIPEIIMRSVHRDVAATVPSLFGYLDEHKIPLDVSVWDNDQGKDEGGQFRPPAQFFDYTGGQQQVMDQALWDRFRAKGHETILHVDAPQT